MKIPTDLAPCGIFAVGGALAGTAVCAIAGAPLKKGAAVGSAVGFLATAQSDPSAGFNMLAPVVIGLVSLPVIGIALFVRGVAK